MIRKLFLVASHLGMLVVGFALGVYMLPILTAPPAPNASELKAAAVDAAFKGRFERNLKGSDFLHWGEGDVYVGRGRIVHSGKLAPGPDYRLYLAKSFVDTQQGFLAIKAQSAQIGEVKMFNGFVVTVPNGIDVSAYNTVVIWCEAFSQFITAAKYR